MKAAKLLSTQQNADGQNIINRELISRRKLDGSPLELVGNEENGYFIGLGRYKLTENVRTMEEAELLLKSNQYNIITNIIAAMLEIYETMKKGE